MHYAGFDTKINSNNHLVSERTMLYQFNDDQEPELTSKLLAILGLKSDNLIIQTDPNIESHYRLVLGTDFNPCFNPAKIGRVE